MYLREFCEIFIFLVFKVTYLFSKVNILLLTYLSINNNNKCLYQQYIKQL